MDFAAPPRHDGDAVGQGVTVRAIWGRAAVLVWGLLWAVSGAAQTTPITVTALGHGSHGDRLRLSFSLSAEPVFAIFTLADPARLVIDLSDASWAVPDFDPTTIPYVAGLRHGLFRPGRMRAVFDLTGPTVVERAFSQPGTSTEPARLIVDLAPASEAAFKARAGWPEAARWRPDELAPPITAAPGEVVVAIDPGHGGIDPGASLGGLVEKTIVFDIAQRLATAISATPGYRAFLTRPDDRFVPLAGRITLARAGGAHLMLSLHADTLASGMADGLSIYTLSPQGSDRAASQLAVRENRADLLAGADLEGETDDLAHVLVDLAQRGTMDQSEKLAAALLRSLRGQVDLLDSDPHRRAGFRVLKAPDLPAVLIELGFLNSPADRARLTSPDWGNQVAAALAAGVRAWAAQASPGFLTPKP